MKAKVPRTSRTFDNDGFKLRAGCLCYKDETEREVCIIFIHSCSLEKADVIFRHYKLRVMTMSIMHGS